MGLDLDDALELFEATHGRPLVNVLDGRTMDRVRQAVRLAFAPFLQPAGVMAPASAWLVTARR